MYQQNPDIPVSNSYSMGYVLTDGAHYAKVIVSVASQTQDEAALEVTAYQVNADGSFVLDSLGHPVCTNTQIKKIDASAVHGGQATLNPGWVRDIETPLVSASALPDGWLSGHGNPNTNATPGTAGTHYYDLDSNQPYVYDMGLLETVRQGACRDLDNQAGRNFLFQI